MSGRPTRRGVLAATLLGGACASPEPRFYTLGAVPGVPRPAPTRSIELRRITLAGYLDRANIVRASVDYRLQVASDERWGEPLADMIGRVFAEDVVQRLPGCTVVQENAALGVESELILELDVQRFDADASGRVVLVAQFALRPRRAREGAVARTVRFEVAPTGPETAALAAAMSATLGMLADAVAATVHG